MSDISVVEFQKEYPAINLKMMKENIKQYDLAIIVAYTMELERGFIVKRINKTTAKGTKITFKPCESQEEADKYSKKVNNLIAEYDKKYSAKDDSK